MSSDEAHDIKIYVVCDSVTDVLRTDFERKGDVFIPSKLASERDRRALIEKDDLTNASVLTQKSFTSSDNVTVTSVPIKLESQDCRYSHPVMLTVCDGYGGSDVSNSVATDLVKAFKVNAFSENLGSTIPLLVHPD